MIQISSEAGRSVARLEGEFTIYQAAESKPPLMAAIADSEELEINLAGVTEIDSAGLQLLLLAKREALRTGKSVRLVAHSEATLAVIDLLGLAGYFGDPLVLRA
ncbi:STAS domain-containing protein [Niveibacterium sp. 24ML]|uniref:STAS domain-containing protein n=1 Tax=Niveibacterium sp. 24ML TaxID=2985512 RepID=UPI002270ADAC|nr:STAS domain-containing protein [Niveibacterium sp. 24ML]MCX9154740.1 STAS domain-containing protein [Niveibacterium sp. 24ML]